MNSENVETWHGIIISPTQHVQKSREVYGKNWTHFVYKLDIPFRSIRISDENSSVTLALHFFKLITTPDFFCVPYAPFKATSSTFNPFWHHLLFFMHLLIFLELNGREIEKHYKMNFEKVETWHGIIISPTQHVQKTKEGYGENWMHFVYKLDNLFRSMRVSDEKTHLLHRHFIF